MYQDSMPDTFCFLKYPHHFLHVMSVYRPKIRNIHILEQHSRHKKLLDAILSQVEPVGKPLPDHRNRGQKRVDPAL